MSKTLTVIRKEYLERVRSKSFLIGTILGPALMSLFILLPVLMAESGGDEARNIGVLDPSGTFVEPLRQALADRGSQGVTLVPISTEQRDLEEGIGQLKEMILDGSVQSGLVIDPDFTETRHASFYSKSVSATVARDEFLAPALNRVLRERRFMQAGVAESLHTYLAARTDWSSISISAEGEEEERNEAAAFVMAVVLILMIYIMVIMYGSHTLTAVIEEKSSRIIEVLLASISPGKLMLGKVLGIGLAGLTQFLIWAAAFFLLSQRGISFGEFSLDVSILTPIVLLSFILFFILGFFLYATIYAGVGAMCNTVQDSQQFHTPIVMGLVLPMMMLSFILRAPDSTLSVVLSLVPLFAPVLMFMRVCVQTPPLWQIVLSWALLVLAIWGASRLAGKLFRLGVLMHGASPTWASIARSLRS